MIYVNNAELEKIFGSSSNVTFSTVQVEQFCTLVIVILIHQDRFIFQRVFALSLMKWSVLN